MWFLYLFVVLLLLLFVSNKQSSGRLCCLSIYLLFCCCCFLFLISNRVDVCVISLFVCGFVVVFVCFHSYCHPM